MSWLSEIVAWVMAAFYAVVHNYAFSIVAIGVTFMVLIIPFNLKSTRSMLAMQKLQPKMKELQQQHKNDKLALQQAMSDLYKQEGVNPLGGCIPTIIPLPLLYVLYHVINGMSHVSKVTQTVRGKSVTYYLRTPQYLNAHTRMYHDLMGGVTTTTHFATSALAAAKINALGLNLSVGALKAVHDHLGLWAVAGAFLLVILNVAANFYQQVQISNLNPMIRQNQQLAPQMRMMRYIPIFLGVIWINLGSGLVLYYFVSAVFRVCQQWMMYRYDPKVKELVAKDDHDINLLDAKLKELESKHSPAPGRGGASVNPKLTPPRPFVGPKEANEVARARPNEAPRARSARSNGVKPQGGRVDGANKRSAVTPPPASPSAPPRPPASAGAGDRNRARKRKGR